MKTFTIGDTHGNYRALKQCLERSNFDYENDTLIHLGDICDGWVYVYECVEELLKIKNLIPIKGNHDDWFLQWINTGIHPDGWRQGGLGTLKSYGFNCLGKEWDEFQIKYDEGEVKTNLNPGDLPESHINFFKKQLNYYVDEENRMFVHGGFNRHFPLKEHRFQRSFYWDRDLIMSAMAYKSMVEKGTLQGHGKFKMVENFKDVFIGHTSTQNWGIMDPINAANIWNIDTGAGFRGKLTIMNVETKEYFQSDENCYPDEQGR